MSADCCIVAEGLTAAEMPPVTPAARSRSLYSGGIRYRYTESKLKAGSPMGKSCKVNHRVGII